MFTLKFYSDGNARTRILEADSVSVLRFDGDWEITMHRKDGDSRMDVSSRIPAVNEPPVYEKVIIENSAGKTTEIIYADDAFYEAVQAAA